MAKRRVLDLLGTGKSEKTNRRGRQSPEPPSRWGIPLIFLAAIAALWLGFRLVPDLGALVEDVPLLSPAATSEPKLPIRPVATTPPSVPTASSGQGAQPSPTPRVALPDLTQLSEERAVALLEQYRLAAEIEEVFAEDVAPGLVVSQAPPANTEVDEGFTVTVRISKGPENPTMPDVVGTTADSAREKLQPFGVDVEMIEQGSATIPAGTVIAQEPTAGSQIEVGSTVRLTVSAGVDRLQVPDVRGKQLAIAQQELLAIGLRGVVGIELTDDPGTCGTVASQDLEPGIPVEQNTEVRLNIRGGSGCTPP